MQWFPDSAQMPIAEYSYFIATPVVIIKHLRPWLDFLVVEKVVMDRHIVSRQLPGHACEGRCQGLGTFIFCD